MFSAPFQLILPHLFPYTALASLTSGPVSPPLVCTKGQVVTQEAPGTSWAPAPTQPGPEQGGPALWL